ncbi:ribonuclease T2 [Starkeya koreensis]|uniref:Ribonuclease T2 n=1 Tax=Ancylobacter koreensis TaxID=266121 RepID=A0ABT0DPW2_9HYPH|nr:ribonuclease T2 [Ancylobacter koreensis]MCK0209320.1 ribonuclease T2 [Ancylobacter koreensis]
MACVIRAFPAWLLLAALASWPQLALAQQKGEPGRFDHYVLALSWSPSYCEAMGERAEPAQCATARPFAFVVHGLWPQYARGWPESCLSPAPYVPEPVLRSMLDVMPSRRLVLHEWRTHGTCATPDPAAYFDKVRRAYEGVTIPDAFRRLDAYRMVSPGEVEAAFRAANPGLGADMIAVDCDGRRLKEVRICLDRSLGFASCPEVDRRACRAERVVMPPVRGATARP